MLKEGRIVNMLLTDYNFLDKNVLEFGPTVVRECLGLMKHLNNKSNNYAIDKCIGYKQNKEEALKISNELNFTLEINDYSNVLTNLDLLNEYNILYKNFYDFIYAQCSISDKYIENMMKLCNIIGKKDCTVFLMPWTNNDDLSHEYYVNFYNNINYEKYGFKLFKINDEYMKKMNYLMKYNIIITKNINIPEYMLI